MLEVRPVKSGDVKRFLSKFIKGLPDECWPWIASRFHKTSYGQFRGAGDVLAHRFSYRFFKGRIPVGLLVLHSCDNPGCVNPNHLFLGTSKDNTADMIAKGRRGAFSLGPGDRACKGEDHGQAVLTEQDVATIRSLYRRVSYHGSNARQLALEFGVNQNQITRIVKGKRWKHV